MSAVMTEVINGAGSTKVGETPLEALQDFYHAFNRRDPNKTSDNWAPTERVIMCNPIGGIRRGWDAIHQGYERIMQGETQVYVEFYDYQIEQYANMFYAVGRERGYAKRGDEQLELAIRTSRLYQRIDGKWKQVHHHGSIDDPQLLERYQEFING